jgi:hypothetical protein
VGRLGPGLYRMVKKTLPDMPANSAPNPGVQVIKASRALQRRVGTGPVDSMTLQRAHDVMTTSTTDFAVVGRGFLDHLELALMRCQSENMDHAEQIQGLTRPVMDLKANAGMFRYTLVTMLANIMLGFLEAITVLDKDAVEIVAAHHRTLRMIIDKRMSGDGGASGPILIRELQDACNRYFGKRGMKPLNVAML